MCSCYRDNALILNDLYPHWDNADIDGGIFADLWRVVSHSPPAYLSAGVISSLDLIYHGNTSGKKPISTLLYKMYDDERKRLTPESRNVLALSIYLRYNSKWARLWAVSVAEYEAMNNYDMTETGHNSGQHNTTQGGTTKQGVKTTTTEAGSVYGFNSSTAVPSEGSTVTIQGAPNDNTITDSRSGSDIVTGDTRLHRVGNIGVMTTQNLLTEEIALWQWQFYSDMMSDLDRVLTLPLYFGAGEGCQTILGYPPYITTDSLPDGHIGEPYSAQVDAEGDIPITWEIIGRLPGLDIYPVEAVAPVITTETLSPAVIDQSYTQTFAATGTAPIIWTLAGSLPPGVSFDPTVPRLSGTPTTAGQYLITLTARNSYGSDSKAYALTVQAAAGTAPDIRTTSLPGGTTGEAYDQTIQAIGSLPITWTCTGTLPPGVNWIMANHKLSGTPTTAGRYTFTVRAENAYGSDSQSYTVEIASAPVTEYTWGKYWVNTISQNTYSNDSGWGNADWYQDPIVEDANRTSDVTFSVANGLRIGGSEYATTSDGAGITCCKGDDVRVEKYEPRGEQLGWDLTIRTCDKTSTPTYEKGSYISDVTSTNRNAYPDDGKQGDFWYVFVG